MTDDDRRTIEQALSDLDARLASDRYPATTILWEMASRQRQSVPEMLRDYFMTGEPPAAAEQRQAAPNSLESLSDRELVDKARWVLSNREVHHYFTRDQLSFLDDLEFKLERRGPFSSRQRTFIIDMVRKCERALRRVAA